MTDAPEGYEFKGVLAYIGKKDCDSVICRRAYDPVTRTASPDCMGYHCPTCDAPTSMMGHDCPEEA